MNIARVLVAALCLHCAGFVFADEAEPDPNKPQRIEMNITAAAEPRPALKYSLEIGLRERVPGNAAQFYYRALMARRFVPDTHWKQFDENDKAWLEEPLDDKKLAAMKEWLNPLGTTLGELKTAVYREHCDWDLQLQGLKGTSVISFLLPEMQDARTLARVLRLKARIEIAERRYDDAIETLRWGYRLAHDCAEQPLLISNLVGIAISAIMTEQLTELIKAPGAPNMYWAIATLPQPLVDVRRALEFERGFPEQIFPFLKDAETVDRSPQEWQRVLEETVNEIGKLSNDMQLTNAQTPNWLQHAGMTLMLAKAYPLAKKELIEQGMDPQRVEAMSVAQVVAIQTARKTREAYDDVYKVTLLPYPESLKMAVRVDESLKGRMSATVFFGTQGLPIAQMLLPGTLQVKRAEIRSPRQFAALQAIEAIRMHAATNGKLPATLAEITVVPVPLNPITREPYPYQVKDNEAVLEIPLLADEQPRNAGKRYVIRLVK
ncbi:hypothetical protein [Anatilimnocola floriformis]|uniref:hypothetical protein n=1 Tax=Anatilimnocola floriformis TaxID=2948575 RepID=UPI0020C4AA2E|nr:hypothetical protein [Anatilimnocola floriformis]